MARLPRNEEIKRRNKMRKMVDEGYDHNQIAEVLGMRPQNVLQMMRRLEQTADEEVVTPVQQRETLNEVTDRIYMDLDALDELITVLEKNPEKYEIRLEKLYRLKKEYYADLANIWAIPSSISSDRQTLSSVRGDKVQINLAKIDYKKLDEAAAEAAKALDEARLKDEHRSED